MVSEALLISGYHFGERLLIASRAASSRDANLSAGRTTLAGVLFIFVEGECVRSIMDRN